MNALFCSVCGLGCRSVVVVLLALGLAGCASPRPAASKPFRVMTYNIHHGEGLDGKVDLQRIAELIRQEEADIVALQEVDRGVERTARRDFPAELAALTRMTCIFSNNYHYQGGEYGNALLTRLPVRFWTNLHFTMPRPSEQRGILQVTLEVEGRKLILMNTHIDFRPDDSERLQNVAQIHGLLAAYRGRPIILCGDFNDTPGSRVHEQLTLDFLDAWLAAGVGDGWTIPAAKPAKRIDYLWISRSPSLLPLKVWVPVSEASDHRPVVGEFRFP